MTATKADLIRWFDEGVELGATHMIVVCDRFNYDNFPVYIPTNTDPFGGTGDVISDPREYKIPHQGHSVDECYDLRMSKDFQMSERRAHEPESDSSKGIWTLSPSGLRASNTRQTRMAPCLVSSGKQCPTRIATCCVV